MNYSHSCRGVFQLALQDAKSHAIVRAYDLAMQHKQEAAQRAEEARLETLSNVHILELRVEPDARAANQAIRDLEWPAGVW